MTKARSNAVAEAAKGDLSVGSGTNLAGILAVGSNGETLVADSSTSTGLRYQGSMAGGKNPVINGGFDIWQRGTTTAGATGSSSGYAADRWQLYRGGFAAGATLSRQATGDTTNLPFIQYCARVQRNSGNTSTDTVNVSQNFESVMAIPYAGKTVTVSFYARAGANFSAASSLLYLVMYNGTGTDQNGTTGAGYTGSNLVVSQAVTLTTTWQRFSVNVTIPTTSTEFYTNFAYAPVGTAGTNDYFEFTGVQLEVGSVATQFSRAGGTIQGELAACQRYYQRSSGNQYMTIGGWGSAINTTNVRFQFPNKATMRVYPTSLDYGTLAVTPDATASAIAVTTLTLVANTDVDSVILNAALTGATQYRPYQIYLNATPSHIGVSAEL